MQNILLTLIIIFEFVLTTVKTFVFYHSSTELGSLHYMIFL